MAAGIYIKMDPVKGESTDSAHTDWMEAMDFSFGVSNPTQMGSGQGAASTGNANFMEFSFSKIMDGSSPDLNAFCATGKKFPEVEIQLCMTLEEKQQVYMVYKLKNAFISSVTVGGGGDQKPSENISLAYSEIEWKFTTYDHMGKKKADFTKGHDLATNKGK